MFNATDKNIENLINKGGHEFYNFLKDNISNDVIYYNHNTNQYYETYIFIKNIIKLICYIFYKYINNILIKNLRLLN